MIELLVSLVTAFLFWFIPAPHSLKNEKCKVCGKARHDGSVCNTDDK